MGVEEQTRSATLVTFVGLKNSAGGLQNRVDTLVSLADSARSLKQSALKGVPGVFIRVQ